MFGSTCCIFCIYGMSLEKKTRRKETREKITAFSLNLKKLRFGCVARVPTLYASWLGFNQIILFCIKVTGEGYLMSLLTSSCELKFKANVSLV